MQKSTQDLLHQLKETDDIQAFLDENEAELLSETVSDFLGDLLAQRKMKISDVVQKSEQGDYIYKVFAGKRHASRDILISISIAMGITFSETQTLLRIAQMAALDPRKRRDSVLIYALNNILIFETVNKILYDIGESTL